MKRAVLIALAIVMMVVFVVDDAHAQRYIRINGVWIWCCSGLESTVIISDFEALRKDPFRVIEYSNMAGTAVCRHNNTGELLGNAWTGPEGKLTHAAKFTETEALDGFDRDKKYAVSTTVDDILNIISADEACPNGKSFTLEHLQLTSLSFTDNIYICSEFGAKGNKTCLSLMLVDSLSGDCTWVDGDRKALCTETDHQHFDVDGPGKGKGHDM